MTMRLAEIRPGSLARPDIWWPGCPLKLGQVILRDLDGSLFPAVDPEHETFTRPGYQRATEFSVIAQGLSTREISLYRKNARAWDELSFRDSRFSSSYLAEAIGRAHETERAALDARATLESMLARIEGREP